MSTVILPVFSSGQYSPHPRQEADEEFCENVRGNNCDCRKQEIDEQRDSGGCCRACKTSRHDGCSFVYESYDNEVNRIEEHTLAHPWTDLRKAHSTGKRPARHRHSHTVKAGPEDGRFGCDHPPVTEYRDHDSRQTFCKTAPSHMSRDDTGCISIFVLWGSFLFFVP